MIMKKNVAKITTKILALFIVMCIAWAQQSVTTIASEIVAQATDEVAGTLGDNGGFKWRFEKSTGTLTEPITECLFITANGFM